MNAKLISEQVKENKKRAPIKSLIIPWPRNWIGLIGSPTTRSNKMTAPNTDITTIGSNKILLSSLFYTAILCIARTK